MYDMAIQVIKNKKAIYIANILIAKKELFDEYAAWLFDILFELEKQIQPEVLKRDDYQKRAYGFLSERLTLIFINHKIKEGIKAANAPLLTIEPKFTKYINYKFNHVIRNRILIKLGIKKEKYKLKYRKIEEGKLL